MKFVCDQLTFGIIMPTKMGATMPVMEPAPFTIADNEPA